MIGDPVAAAPPALVPLEPEPVVVLVVFLLLEPHAATDTIMAMMAAPTAKDLRLRSIYYFLSPMGLNKGRSITESVAKVPAIEELFEEEEATE